MSSDLAQTKVALITGAAGGIGHALCDAFATKGYLVLAMDIADNPATLACHHYIQADLSRYVAEESYAKDINHQINKLCDGRLDALINNAAIQIVQRVEMLTRDDWQRTLNVNLLAPFFLIQGLIRELSETRGSVVNISSIHARLTKQHFVAYATSKAALSAMTRATCLELGQRFRVNAIEPAAIETEMLKQGLFDIEGAYEALKDYHPVGRIGLPKDVAGVAVWLCSAESDFINGTCIQVDGAISNVLSDPNDNRAPLK